MSYGLKIYRDDGSLFISPDVAPMNYIGKFRYTGNSTIQTNVPTWANIISFIRNDTNTGAAYVVPRDVGGVWHLDVNTNATDGYIYVFANIVTVTTGVGMAVYNASGVMVWNTDCLPLQVLSVDNPFGGGSGQGANYDVDVGVPAAVISGMSSTFLTVLSGAEQLYIYGTMVARAYGNIIGAYARDGVQIQGAAPTARFKQRYLYIDTRFYP